MKKLILPALLLLTSGSLYALPMGNPADPLFLSTGLVWSTTYVLEELDESENDSQTDDCEEIMKTYVECNPFEFWNYNLFNLRAGYYGDFVYNRNLELLNFGHKAIDRTQLYTNAGLLIVNFCERFNIYGTFGSTKICINTNASTFVSIINERIEIETESDFSWTLGGKLTFFQCGCTFMGLDGKYFRSTPHIRRITRGGDVSLYPDDFLKIRYHEWQLGVGIAHRINMFVPYFGLKWSHAKAEFDEHLLALSPIPGDTARLRGLQQRDNWGLVYGVSIVDSEFMSLTVEGRCRDEKALHINAQMRF